MLIFLKLGKKNTLSRLRIIIRQLLCNFLISKINTIFHIMLKSKQTHEFENKESDYFYGRIHIKRTDLCSITLCHLICTMLFTFKGSMMNEDRFHGLIENCYGGSMDVYSVLE